MKVQTGKVVYIRGRKFIEGQEIPESLIPKGKEKETEKKKGKKTENKSTSKKGTDTTLLR